MVLAVLSTKEAAAADETGAAIRIKQARYERGLLDFEAEARRRRDAMHAEDLDDMCEFLGGEA